MDENEYKLQLLQDTITSNAQTIERLADALELALTYTDVKGSLVDQYAYANKRWPNGWTTSDIYDAMIEACALLAEIPGAKCTHKPLARKLYILLH